MYVHVVCMKTDKTTPCSELIGIMFMGFKGCYCGAAYSTTSVQDWVVTLSKTMKNRNRYGTVKKPLEPLKKALEPLKIYWNRYPRFSGKGWWVLQRIQRRAVLFSPYCSCHVQDAAAKEACCAFAAYGLLCRSGVLGKSSVNGCISW